MLAVVLLLIALLLFGVFVLGLGALFIRGGFGLPAIPLPTDAPDVDVDDGEREDHPVAWPREANGDADADPFGFDLADSFAVAWLDASDRRVGVTDGDHEATFRVVDRDGSLAVRPESGARERRDATDRWFADAADALGAVLPGRLDALDDHDTGWPGAADGVVDPDAVAELETRVLDPRSTEDTPTTDSASTRRVEVSGEDITAVVVVEPDRVAFEREDARTILPDRWTNDALAAADLAVNDDRDDHDGPRERAG